jgi:glycerol-3-phosphate dehydrogenase (NAD(P)+)
MTTIGVIGGGAWGTALATVAARAGNRVTMWVLEPEVAEAINRTHENTTYLPGVALPEGISASPALEALAGMDAYLLVPPAQFMRKTTADLAPHITEGAPVAICSKGIEQKTNKLMSEVVGETLPRNPAVILSGPTFAIEVARGLPTAVTLAGPEDVAERLAQMIGIAEFRPYVARDVIGAQIGGAIKNVLAIAAGITIGKKLGDNAHAALITRSLAELIQFGRALGADPMTLMGLSGLGDLILTAGSLQSRNTSLGKALGEGKTVAQVLGGRKSVSEGVYTASAVVAMAQDMGISMPICTAVDKVLNHGFSVDEEIRWLLQRPFTPEFELGA